MPDRIDKAIQETLRHLQTIEHYFRAHNENQAANELGKLSVQMLNAFKKGFEQIEPEYDSSQEESSGEDDAEEVDSESENASSAGVLLPVVENGKVKNGAAIAGQQIEDNESVEDADEMIKSLTSGLQALRRETEASIAAHKAGLSQQPVQMYGFAGMPLAGMPLTGMPLSGRLLTNTPVSTPVTGTPVAGMPATACFASTVLPEVYVEPKAGMIRIIGPVVRDLLKHITRRIHEGPLLEIRQESRESVLVTFLHATHAMAFLHSSDEMEKTCGSSRIGHGYKIEMVETADWKEEHLRMNQPLRERRRLSFARKKMFSEGMNPTRWEHDIHRLVGSMNIDFLFVFNSGNATVVFNSTAAARVVHDAFQRWKDVPGAYHGVLVSYSSDPCEKELILVREAPRLSYNRYNRRNAH